MPKSFNHPLLKLLIALLLGTPLAAHALNLKRSVVSALARAEETKIASSQVRQGMFALRETEGQTAADINLSSKIGPRYTDYDTADSSSHFYLEANASIDKSLYDGEANRFSVEAAKLQLLATQYQSRAVLEKTTIDVINSYLNVVFLQEITRIHIVHISEYRKVEEITEARAATGVATDADLMLVRARVISAEAALNRARLELARAQSQYSILVGPIENDMVIPFILEDIFFQSYELLSEKMYRQNSQLQQTKYQRRVSLAELNVLNSDASPRLSASLESAYSNTYNGGAGMALSLGGYINLNYATKLGQQSFQNSVFRQQERLKELALLRELLIRDLETKLQQEFSSYQSYRKVIRSLERELQANQGVLLAQKEQQKIGRVELIDILNNQDRVNNTYIRLLEARQENHQVRYRMMELSGELLSHFRN